MLEACCDHAAHPLNLFWRWAAIDAADHLLPDRVKANVAADVHGETRLRQPRHLPRDVQWTIPIRVEDLRRHTLHQHVDGRRQRVGRGVAVDVDEAGSDHQAFRVDRFPGEAAGQIADRDDEAVADADVGHKARIAAAVYDGAAAEDDVEGRRLCVEHGTEEHQEQ